MNDKIIAILQDLIESGNEPTVIKELVINTVDEYFQNKDNLNKYVTSSEILSTFEFLIRYHHDGEFSLGLKEVLTIYRDALVADPTETLQITLSTLKDFSNKENLMWTVKQNTPNEATSDLYDLIISYMKHIGDTLEIGTKHIIFELYALLRIIKGKTIDYDQIQKLDYGLAINNILDQKKCESILKTSPISIKLSDWRNIAYHHSYRIEYDKIICTYGKQDYSFELTFDQFKSYVHQIVRASNIFNIARCIFVFDNLDSMLSSRQPINQSIAFRKPLLINQFKISLLSQGFLLAQHNEEDNKVTVYITDLMNDGSLNSADEQKRKIHSSQFLYNLWCITPKTTLAVIYSNKYGQNLLKSTVAGKVCEEIACAQQGISYLASHVEFEVLH